MAVIILSDNNGYSWTVGFSVYISNLRVGYCYKSFMFTNKTKSAFLFSIGNFYKKSPDLTFLSETKINCIMHWKVWNVWNISEIYLIVWQLK